MVKNSTILSGDLVEKHRSRWGSQRALARMLGDVTGIPGSTVRHWLRKGEAVQRMNFRILNECFSVSKGRTQMIKGVTSP